MRKRILRPISLKTVNVSRGRVTEDDSAASKKVVNEHNWGLWHFSHVDEQGVYHYLRTCHTTGDTQRRTAISSEEGIDMPESTPDLTFTVDGPRPWTHVPVGFSYRAGAGTLSEISEHFPVFYDFMRVLSWLSRSASGGPVNVRRMHLENSSDDMALETISGYRTTVTVARRVELDISCDILDNVNLEFTLLKVRISNDQPLTLDELATRAAAPGVALAIPTLLDQAMANVISDGSPAMGMVINSARFPR